MDPAYLRRIPYKIKLLAPNPEEYQRTFHHIAMAHGFVLSDDDFDFMVERLTASGQFGLAYYQP